VSGAGPIGLFLVQVSLAAGAEPVVATDPLPHRVAAAGRIGATAVHVDAGDSGDALARDAVHAATDGRGVDIAFDASGSDASLGAAVRLTRPAGTVVVVGIPPTDTATLAASTARRKELTVRFARRMNATYPEAIRLAVSGAVDIRSIVTDACPLDAFAQAFDRASARAGLKVVIRPSSAVERVDGRRW
jgi:L-iditol 2-dehydrogenase